MAIWKTKGGIDTTLAFLDKQAGKIAQQIKDFWEVDLDDIPGSGAAGGIGGALFFCWERRWFLVSI